MRPTNLLIGTLAAALLLGAATATRAAGAEEAIERFLIQELQSRYALAHDLTDPAMYAAVFTEDAELHGAGRMLAKGREALHAIGVKIARASMPARRMTSDRSASYATS